MQTFFIFTPTVRSPRGAHPGDPSVEDSGLGALIKQTFARLQLPDAIGGCVKVQQRHDNPDVFDLYFYSNVHSEKYHLDGTYTTHDVAVFERTDFDDFLHTERQSRSRLQEFARRLVSGELQPARYT